MMTSSVDFEIRLIKPHEKQQVLEFLRAHFYSEEPLTVSSGDKKQVKEDEDFNISNIEQNMSFMAVRKTDLNAKEEIAGVIISGSKGADEAKHLFEEAAKFGPTKWGRTLHFLACVERDANIFKRFNIQKVLHVQVLAVNSSIRGQNIGKRLVEATVRIAKSLNYEMLSGDCTSFYSARLFDRLGFQCVNTQYYKDYLDESGNPVFTPTPPHTCVKTFVSKL